MAETPSAPETTRPADFLVPNQDLIERVIDQRLAAHAANESANKKASSSRSSGKSADDKSGDDKPSGDGKSS